MPLDVAAGINSTKMVECEALSQYTFQKCLSSGRSGSVMVAYNACSIPVVIKSMNKNSVRQDWVDNEVKAGLLLRNKSLVKFRDYFQDETHNYIVLDMVKGDDMWQFMQNRAWQPLTEKETKPIFKQIVKSIEYCHQMGVAHKDIKLENVMIDKKGKTTLIDFGFCEFASFVKLSTRYDGTLDYMPPEELLRHPFSPYKADVFALGVLLFILLTGFFPFELKKRCRQMSKGIKPQVDWKMDGLPSLSESVRDLLEKMLEPASDKRIDLQTLTNHPWMKRRYYFDLWQALPVVKA